MKARPPREGARWGDDPLPEPDPTPLPEPEEEKCPSPHELLSKQFGEANVSRALSILSKVRTEYPHLDIFQKEDIALATDLLTCAKSSMAIAAKDGRVHTMPETLEHAETLLGPTLASNPGLVDISTITINYGDEHVGRRGKELQKLPSKFGIFFMYCFGCFLFIVGFGIYSDSGGSEEGIIAIPTFGLFGGFFIWAARRAAKRRRELERSGR